MPKETFFNLPEAKRAMITELAIEEFSDHSFHEASLSRIVARAGIAKGSMYQYFEDKLDLFRWLLLEEGVRRRFGAIGGLEHLPEGFFERMEVLLVGGMEYLLRDPRMARMGLRLMEPTTDQDLLALYYSTRQLGHSFMISSLEAAVGRGEIRPDLDLTVVAYQIEWGSGPALAEAVMARLGTDLVSYMRDPSCARGDGPAIAREVCHEVVEYLRRALT